MRSSEAGTDRTRSRWNRGDIGLYETLYRTTSLSSHEVCKDRAGARYGSHSLIPRLKAQMATAGIIACVVLLIAVPIFLVNRDTVARRIRHRRHRSTSAPPFLFFPASDESDVPPPAPAWNGGTPGQASARRAAVHPEPGIADLPARPAAGEAGVAPARDGWSRRTGRDRRALP
ncbi:MAG TPA: hypothetical protein VN602_12620 [Gemmatimonadaceae bacterium]|nr:hypothetical protein [Gemmatimonadaceae bacterium]